MPRMSSDAQRHLVSGSPENSERNVEREITHSHAQHNFPSSSLPPSRSRSRTCYTKTKQTPQCATWLLRALPRAGENETKTKAVKRVESFGGAVQLARKSTALRRVFGGVARSTFYRFAGANFELKSLPVRAPFAVASVENIYGRQSVEIASRICVSRFSWARKKFKYDSTSINWSFSTHIHPSAARRSEMKCSIEEVKEQQHHRAVAVWWKP